MTTITILPEAVENDEITYRAIAGAIQSEGKTAGQALDALTKQLSEDESGTLVIVQNLRPDVFFTAEQQQRLRELMARWREVRDNNNTLSPDEQSELQRLMEAELQATAKRAESAISEMSK